MSETSMFTPTEATRKPPAHHKKPSHHNVSPSPEKMMLEKMVADFEGGFAPETKAQRAEASRQRILARLDREIAEKEKPAKEKLKAEMAGLKEKLAGRVKKSKESDDKNGDYEELVVSGGKIEPEKDEKEEKFKEVMTGLKGKLKSREKERIEETDKHDEIEQAAKMYFEQGEGKMNEFLFDENLAQTRLTRKELESKPKELKFLKKWYFSGDNLKQTLEDFLVALPTEEEYTENTLEKIKKSLSGTEPTEDVKDAMAALKDLPPTEAEEDLAFANNLRESGMGELEEAPKVKKEVSPVSNEAEKLKSARTLVEAAAEIPAKKKKPELSPAAIEAIKHSAEEDEAKFVSESQRFAPRKEEEEGKEEENRAARAAKEIHKNRKEMFSEALLQAYKEMGVKITKDNEDDFLVKKPPFSYIFSAKGRKVRDLYSRYIKELK